MTESVCQEHSKDGIQVQGREAITQRLSAMADLHAAMGGSGHHVDSIKTQKAQAKPLHPSHSVITSSCRGMYAPCQAVSLALLHGRLLFCPMRLEQLYSQIFGDRCIAVLCSGVHLAEGLLK